MLLNLFHPTSVMRQDRPALRELIAQVSQRRAAWRMAGDSAPPLSSAD